MLEECQQVCQNMLKKYSESKQKVWTKSAKKIWQIFNKHALIMQEN